LLVNQDFNLDYWLHERGHKLLLDPSLAVAWQSRQRVRDLFLQYRRYGRGKVTVALLHPASLLPRHLMPPALVCATIVGLGVGIRKPRVGGLLIAPYLVSLAGASAVVVQRLPDWSTRRWVPAAFLAMRFGWGLGFLEGMARILVRGERILLPSISRNIRFPTHA